MSSGFVTEAEVGPNEFFLSLPIKHSYFKVEEKKKQRQDEWERVRKPEDPVEVKWICLMMKY